MILLADDPVIRSMENYGWPPWLLTGGSFDEDEEDMEDGYI